MDFEGASAGEEVEKTQEERNDVLWVAQGQDQNRQVHLSQVKSLQTNQEQEVKILQKVHSTNDMQTTHKSGIQDSEDMPESGTHHLLWNKAQALE